MGPKTQQLLAMLDSIAATLEGFGDKHWAGWIADDAQRLRRGDLTAITHFLAAFGGMGSLNDLRICPQNGHRITEAETPAANERLSRDLSDAWSLARVLSRRGT